MAIGYWLLAFGYWLLAIETSKFHNLKSQQPTVNRPWLRNHQVI